MFKFALALLISSSLATETVNFDLEQINIALRLSMDAYCGVDEYATHVFASYSEGFVVTKSLHNSFHDVQGFVGFLPSDKSIYVSYRGSESFSNWFTNIDAVKV